MPVSRRVSTRRPTWRLHGRAKWPVMLLIVIFAVLYYSSLNAPPVGLKSVLPGAVLALVTWLVASVAFALYVANFGSYNKTYGATGRHDRVPGLAMGQCREAWLDHLVCGRWMQRSSCRTSDLPRSTCSEQELRCLGSLA
ncbi:YhjD/YihY/BrkB family envelope integrity protein [Streptomyces hypolithicus]